MLRSKYRQRGPDADRSPTDTITKGPNPNGHPSTQPVNAPTLSFHFAPQMDALVNPPIDKLPFGTDAWAVHNNLVSVTPLRTSFAEPDDESFESSRLVITSDGPAGISQLPIGRPWKL